MNTSDTICMLCSNRTKIEKSHVVPKFAVEWLKKNSATGYLRDGIQPNVRQQDIKRVRMLCGSCERRLSVWEGAFAKRIFLPFRDHEQSAFEYDEWLLKFAVSLAWRTVARSHESFQREHPNLRTHTAQALDDWSRFLLGNTAEIEHYDHHMFLFDVITQAVKTPYPDGMNAYCLLAVDSTIACSDSAVYAYTLLPGIAFWSCIHPFAVEGWEGTRIGRAGTISTPQRVTWPYFGSFVLERATWMRQRQTSISDKQRAAIRQTVRKDPERTLGSVSLDIQCREKYWRERN